MTSGWWDFLRTEGELAPAGCFLHSHLSFHLQDGGKGGAVGRRQDPPRDTLRSPRFRAAMGELLWDSPGVGLAFGWGQLSLRGGGRGGEVVSVQHLDGGERKKAMGGGLEAGGGISTEISTRRQSKGQTSYVRLIALKGARPRVLSPKLQLLLFGATKASCFSSSLGPPWSLPLVTSAAPGRPCPVAALAGPLPLQVRPGASSPLGAALTVALLPGRSCPMHPVA